MNSLNLDWIKNSKFLVTGGAGFIGSNVVEALIANNALEITILDDLCSGKRSNIEAFLALKNVKFVEGSILNLELLKEIVQENMYILHLAAIPSVPRSLEFPIATFNANVVGTQNVLEAARVKKAARVVLSSSSSIYGGITSLVERTEDMTPAILSPYASHKLIGETLCLAFSKSFQVSTVILRYFNIFGPKQDPNSLYAAVIPKFIRQTLNNEQITIFGTGEQSRDFTHVQNAVYANLLATNPHKVLMGEIFNVGCGENYSINDLCEAIQKMTQKKMSINRVDARKGDPYYSKASIKKIQDALGYQVRLNFEAGIRELIAEFTNKA